MKEDLILRCRLTTDNAVPENARALSRDNPRRGGRRNRFVIIFPPGGVSRAWKTCQLEGCSSSETAPLNRVGNLREILWEPSLVEPDIDRTLGLFNALRGAVCGCLSIGTHRM